MLKSSKIDAVSRNAISDHHYGHNLLNGDKIERIKTRNLSGYRSEHKHQQTKMTIGNGHGPEIAASGSTSAPDVKPNSPPKPLVICGPSGSGKSTLLKRLMNEYPNCLGFSISHTTRNPRNGEIHGREYYYVNREYMEQAIKNGEFIEYAEFSGNIYGTSKKSVKDVQDQGKICILDIEIEGVKNMKKTDLNPKYVFVKPPSVDALEKRLKQRGSESERDLQSRLERSLVEITYGEKDGNFDLVIVNDNIEHAYEQLKNFVESSFNLKLIRDKNE